MYIHIFPDIDDCTPGLCENSGTCLDGIDTFTCSCTEWYTGATCQLGRCIYWETKYQLLVEKGI